MPEMSSASVAKINLPGARIGDHLGARTLDDDFAVVQYRDALGKCQRRVHIVLDHHDGHIARDGVEQRAYPLSLGLRKAGERLVEQQDSRLLGERHRELEPAPLAAASRSPARSSAAWALA